MNASSLAPISILLAVAAYSATRPQSEEPKWEYLVVSPGRFLYSSSMEDLSKNSGFKTSAVLSMMNPEFMEATGTQVEFDRLGLEGWELVSVSGDVGRQQQCVFKRPMSKERSKADAERIAEERRKLDELQKSLPK